MENNLKYEALLAKFNSNRLEAKATLEVYFENSTGIGEHPGIIEEMTKLVETMATAEDNIKSIKENFGEFPASVKLLND
jgi:hypothetical protein